MQRTVRMHGTRRDFSTRQWEGLTERTLELLQRVMRYRWRRVLIRVVSAV